MKLIRKEIGLTKELFNGLKIKAEEKGLTISALIKMYLIKSLKEDNSNEK